MAGMKDIEFINPNGIHAPAGYSHIGRVLSGRPAWIAGQVALDPSGNLVGPGDIEAQTRQVFKNLEAALSALGLDFRSVVKLNYYIVDIADAPVVRRVRDEFVDTNAPPASTAVGVTRLVREDLLIEVEAIAIAPD